MILKYFLSFCLIISNYKVLGAEHIILFVSNSCSYCKAAQNYLANASINFKIIDITNDKAKRLELYNQTGQSTVPYIFIGKNFIGGYSQLIKTDLKKFISE